MELQYLDLQVDLNFIQWQTGAGEFDGSIEPPQEMCKHIPSHFDSRWPCRWASGTTGGLHDGGQQSTHVQYMPHDPALPTTAAPVHVGLLAAHANNIDIAEDGINLTYEVFPVPWFGVCPLQDFVYPIMVNATKCEFTLLLGEADELSSLELWGPG